MKSDTDLKGDTGLKKAICHALILAGILSLCACGNTGRNGSANGADAVSNMDSARFIEDFTDPGEQSIYFHAQRDIAAGSEGYYCLNGITSKYLTYISKDGAEETYLCNKPGCSHISEKYYGCLETCNAYAGFVPACPLVYHDGYLYMLSEDGSQNVSLVRISGDGSIHENIMVIGQIKSNNYDNYNYVFLDDNTLLMSYNSGVSAAGGTMQQSFLYTIDIEKKEMTEVYSHMGKDLRIRDLRVVNKNCFFLMSEESGLKEDNYYWLMDYDAGTKETVKVLDVLIDAYVPADNGQLFYSVYEDGVYKYNVQTKEAKRIWECSDDTASVSLAYDGTYLYMDNFNAYMKKQLLGVVTGDDSARCRLIVCTPDGNEVNTIYGHEARMKLSDGDYILWNTYVPEKGDTWFYIKKSDIAEPDVTWKTVG